MAVIWSTSSRFLGKFYQVQLLGRPSIQAVNITIGELTSSENLGAYATNSISEQGRHQNCREEFPTTHVNPEVTLLKVLGTTNLASQHTTTNRRVSDDGDAEFTTRLQQSNLGVLDIQRERPLHLVSWWISFSMNKIKHDTYEYSICTASTCATLHARRSDSLLHSDRPMYLILPSCLSLFSSSTVFSTGVLPSRR